MTIAMSSDGLHALHHTWYKPTGDVQATLLIVHGMAEHSGRYARFAQFLADNGIAVLTYDHLGHGQTVHTDDELGYFADQHPMQTLLKDAVLMADVLRHKYPNVPHLIMGHSMGSFIVRVVLQHHSRAFVGAILMGTSDSSLLTTATLPLTHLLNKVASKQRNTALANLTNRMLNAKLEQKVTHKHAWICQNENTVIAYDNDPLCGFTFTNNGYWTLFQLMNKGLSNHWSNTVDKRLSMLLVSGKNDPVGNMGKGVQKVTDRLRQHGFDDVQIKLYAGMRHEPLHEDGYELVYNDLLQWLTDQSKQH